MWCVGEVEVCLTCLLGRRMASSYEVCAGTALIGRSPWHLRLYNHIVPCTATWTMYGHVGCQQRGPGYVYSEWTGYNCSLKVKKSQSGPDRHSHVLLSMGTTSE